jgi:hypothetical protein
MSVISQLFGFDWKAWVGWDWKKVEERAFITGRYAPCDPTDSVGNDEFLYCI